LDPKTGSKPLFCSVPDLKSLNPDPDPETPQTLFTIYRPEHLVVRTLMHMLNNFPLVFQTKSPNALRRLTQRAYSQDLTPLHFPLGAFRNGRNENPNPTK
jgi:hypothetical protein